MPRLRKSAEVSHELLHQTRFRKSLSVSVEKLPVIPQSKAGGQDGRSASRKTLLSTSSEELQSPKTTASKNRSKNVENNSSHAGKDAVVETARRKDNNAEKLTTQSVLPPAKQMIVLPPCEVLLLHENTNALEMLANCSLPENHQDENPSHGSVVPELIGANEVIDNNASLETDSDLSSPVPEQLCVITAQDGKLPGKLAEMARNAPENSNTTVQLENVHLVVPTSSSDQSRKKKRGRKPKIPLMLDISLLPNQESPPTPKKRGRKSKALPMLDAPTLMSPELTEDTTVLQYAQEVRMNGFVASDDNKSTRSPSPVLPLIVKQQNAAKTQKSMLAQVENKVPVIEKIPTMISQSLSAVEVSDSVGGRSSVTGSRTMTSGAVLQPAARSKPVEPVSGVVPVRALADSTQSSPNVSPDLPRMSFDPPLDGFFGRVYEPPSKKQKPFHSGNISLPPTQKPTPNFSISNVVPGAKRKSKPRRKSAQDGADGPEKGRMLMREWLEKQADDAEGGGGIEWFDRRTKIIKIAWKHGSKSGWSANDSRVFVNWAKYTGRYKEGDNEFKRWKANFRCALRSLSDVKEVKDKTPARNGEQYKVYQLLEPAPRKRLRASSESTPSPRRRSTGCSMQSMQKSPCFPFLSQFHEDQLAVQSLSPIISTTIPTPVDLPSPTSSSSPPPMETAHPTFVPDPLPVCMSSSPGGSILLFTSTSGPNGVVPFCFQLVGNGDHVPGVDSSTDHSYANAVFQPAVATVVRPASPLTPSEPLLPSQQAQRKCNSVIPTVVDRFSLSSDEESEAEEEDNKCRIVPVDSTTYLHVYPYPLQPVTDQPMLDCSPLLMDHFHEMQPLLLGDARSNVPAVSVVSVDGACDFDSPPRSAADDFDGMDQIDLRLTHDFY